MVGTFHIKQEGQDYLCGEIACKETYHKYGIEVPRTVEEAYLMDKHNKNTLRRDAI